MLQLSDLPWQVEYREYKERHLCMGEWHKIQQLAW